MDRRQQKTRQAIFQALSGLLTEKRFHQITVEEIAQRANIGRSTFYAHFKTKEELLAQMCREIFSHVLAPRLEGEDTHDFSLERDPYALVTHLLYHIRDKRRDLAAIIAGGQGEGFWGPFQQWVAGPLLEWMLEGRDKETLAIPYSFLAGHIANSLIYLIRWWMEQGMTATPEEMAAIFWKITDPLLSEPAQDTRP